MNIATGKLQPDEGKIEWSKNVRTGYLDQHTVLEKGQTIRDVLKSAFQYLFALEEKMNQICDSLGDADPEEMEALMEELGTIQDTLTLQDFYIIDSKVEEVARALGLLDIGLERDVTDLSGGQRTKVLLAKLLLEKPEFRFKVGRTPGKYIFETKDLVIGYDEPLSKPLTLSMERGHKIALIGANGIGKTTLLKSILGLIKPLKGSVELGENLLIGYFEQESAPDNKTTCIEEIWSEFPSFTQYEVRSALAKCGLTTKHIESQVRVLSGGEQAKVRLCKLINRETNILLLDEPTNHLDVDAKAELKRALQEYNGSILLICHEPDFYQDVVNEVWDCTKWTTKII